MAENQFHESRQILFQRSRKRALDCLHDSEYSRAFGHLIVAMNIDPDDESLVNIFLFTLGLLSNQLEIEENWMELLNCYQEALAVLPYNSQVLHGLATALFRMGHLESAMSYFQKAYRENPRFTPSLYCIDNLRNVLVERWHFAMLNDKGRNIAFQQAIQNAVKNGYENVLDIGAGTGILSMIAADAGAKSVYACESSAVMFEIMKNVLETNSKKVHTINKLSYDVKVPDDLPERVSLVLTETFDAGVFGEHVLDIVSDAWKRLLKVDDSKATDDCGQSDWVKPKVLPQSVVIWSVPIHCEALQRQIKADSEVMKAFGLENVQLSSSVSHKKPYSTERLRAIHGSYTALCQAKEIMKVDFNDLEQVEKLRAGRSFNITYNCNVAGHVDAIAVWFDLHLDDDHVISTSPEQKDTCWEQAIFYVPPSILSGSSNLKAGDNLEAHFSCKGHLSLVKVSSELPYDENIIVPVHSAIVQSLNRHHFDKTLYLNLVEGRTPEECVLLDMSLVPVLGLKSIKSGIKKAVIMPNKYQMDLDELQKICGISREKVRVMFQEDICTGSMTFDVCITEPVERSGLLRKNILEDIAFLRNKSSTQTPAIYPKKLSIFAMLIDSPYLYKHSKILSDENCSGYKISKFLNVYQCKIHQDIQLQTLPHVPLCSAVKLCDIQLNGLSLEKNKLQPWTEFHGCVKVEIKQNGTVSAIPFWFEMSYDTNDSKVSTLSAKGLWKQAAVIPDEAVPVSSGEMMSLNWTCRNSCLYIDLKS